MSVIQAIFARLQTHLHTLALSHTPALTCLADKTIATLSGILNKTILAKNVPEIISLFCSLLLHFSQDEILSIVLVKLMALYCEAAKNTNHIIFSPSLFHSLFTTLLPLKTHYLLRAVFHIFLNVSSFNPILGAQGQTHRSLELPCDALVDQILLFVLTKAPWSFLCAAKAHFEKTLSKVTEAGSADQAYWLLDQKLHYGVVELFGLVSVSLKSVGQHYSTLAEIAESLKGSPILLQIYCFFATRPVLRWAELDRLDYASASENNPACLRLFDALAPVTTKHSGSHHVHPLAATVNARSLLAMTVANTSLLDRIAHQKKKDKRSDREAVIFSHLSYISETPKQASISDLHRCLLLFNTLAIPAAYIAVDHPDYALVRYVKSILPSAVKSIGPVALTLTTLAAETPLMEHEKVRYWAAAMVLSPETIGTALGEHLEHALRDKLYHDFITLTAVKLIFSLPGGVEALHKHYLVGKNVALVLKRAKYIVTVMEDTRKQHAQYLEQFSPYRADTNPYPALVEPSKATTEAFVRILKYPGGFCAARGAIECDPGVFNSVGLLCRRVYEVSTQYARVDPYVFAPVDPNCRKDADMLADMELFDRLAGEAASVGPVYFHVIMHGMFDCQQLVRACAQAYMMSQLKLRDFREKHLYFIFSHNLYSLREWALRLESCALDASAIVAYLNYVACFMELYVRRVDWELIFRLAAGSYLEKSSLRLCKAYYELATVVGRTMYVFLSLASPATYPAVRTLAALWSEFYGIDHPAALYARTYVLPWGLIEALCADAIPAVRSARLLEKKVVGLLTEHTTNVTPGLRSAAAIIWLRIDPSSTYFAGQAALLSAVWGAEMSTEINVAHAATKGQPPAELVLMLIDLLSLEDLALRSVADQVLLRDLHPKLCFLAFGRFLKELEKIREKSHSTVLPRAYSERAGQYYSVLDRLHRRVPGLILFQNLWAIVEICQVALDTIQAQYEEIEKAGLRRDKDGQLVGYGKFKLAAVRFILTAFELLDLSRTRSSYHLIRNDALKTLVSWLEILFFKDEGLYFSGVGSTVFKEIMLELLLCVAIVSNGLKVIRRNLNFDTEIDIFRRVMLGHYYNVLLRILKKCLADTKELEIQAQYGVSAPPKVLEFSRIELQKLTQWTMTALGNLVALNYDIGLQHVLPLLLDESPVIRDTFLRIFRGILRLKGRQSGPKVDPLLPEIFEFCKPGLLLADFVIAVRNTIPAPQVDRVSRLIFLILILFESFQRALRLLINYELMVSLEPLDMLRRNNLTTRLLLLAGKTYGDSYLRDSVGKVLDQIVINEDYFEVTPFYTDGISSEDQAKFFHYFSLLVDSVCVPVAQVPAVLRAACYSLRRAVSETADEETGLVAVTTFFFLRFLCPAVTLPEEMELLEFEPSAQAGRCFVLLAKALQNAGNGTLNIEKFPLLQGKELEMHALGDKLQRFVDGVSASEVSDAEAEPGKSDRFELEDFRVIQTFLVEQCHPLRQHMTLPSLKCEASLEMRYNYFENVLAIFLQIGLEYMVLYPDVADFVRIHKGKYSQLHDTVRALLEHPMLRALTGAPFFYESVAKDGTQVHVIALAALDAMDVDPQLLFLRVVQLLARSLTQTYYVVFDCTLFNQATLGAVALRMIDMLVELVPDELTAMCARVFYVNVSSVFLPYLIRRLENRASSSNKFLNPNHLKMIFLLAFEDARIIEDFNLLEWHGGASNGKDFVDLVSYIQDDGKSFPVYLRLGGRYAVYTLGESKRVKIGRFTKNFKVVNFEPLADWRDFQEDETPQHFLVYLLLLGQTLHFKLENFEEIILMFYLKLGELEAEEDKEVEEKEDNLVGEVFMALALGMLQGLPEVRRSAYDLFGDVVEYIERERLKENKSEGAPFSTKNDKVRFKFGRFKEVTLESVGESSPHPKEVEEESPTGISFAPPQSALLVAEMLAAVATAHPQIAGQIFSAFTRIVERGTASAKQLYLVVAPWVLQARQHTLLAPGGATRMRAFITAAVRAAPADDADWMRLGAQVWGTLAADPAFADVAVDAAVREALWRRFLGKSDDGVIAMTAAKPAQKTCAAVLRRLIAGARLPRRIRGQIARARLHWTTVSLLLRLAVPMFFDRVRYVEQFLGKLAFVVAIYHRAGTLETRYLLQQLAANVLSTLASNPALSEESRKALLREAQPLRLDLGKTVFGLEARLGLLVMDMDAYAHIHEYHIEFFALKVVYERLVYPFQIPDYGPTRLNDIWATQLLDLSMQVMRDDGHILQGKAATVIAHVLTLGIPDILAQDYLRKMLRLYQKVLTRYELSTLGFVSIALGRVCEGLQNDLRYFPIIIWIAITQCLYDNQLLVQVGVAVLGRVIFTMHKRGFFRKRRVWDVLSLRAGSALPVMERYLDKPQLVLIFESEIFVATITLKSVCNPQVLAGVRHFLFELAEVRLECAKTYSKNLGEPFESDLVTILVPLFAVSGHAEVAKVLQRTNIASGVADLGGGEQVPDRLVEFALGHRKIPRVVLVILLQMIRSPTLEMRPKARILRFFRHLGHRDRLIIELVFPLIMDACKELCLGHIGFELRAVITDIQAMAAESFRQDAPYLYEQILGEYLLKLESFLTQFKYVGFVEQDIEEFRRDPLTRMVIAAIKMKESLGEYLH